MSFGTCLSPTNLTTNVSVVLEGSSLGGGGGSEGSIDKRLVMEKIFTEHSAAFKEFPWMKS